MHHQSAIGPCTSALPIAGDGSSASRILFITDRNVVNTCGELRLIKNRARALYCSWNIATDFFALTDKRRLSRLQEDIGPGSSLAVFPYSAFNYLSYIASLSRMKRSIEHYMRTRQTNCVVLSGIRVLPLAKWLRTAHPEVMLVADIHGAYEELLEFPPDSLLLKHLFKVVYNHCCRLTESTIQYFDGAFVVSRALQSYVAERFHGSNLRYYVVPCTVSRTTIDIRAAARQRSKWRKEFGVAADSIVFIYSGGISRWQAVDATKELYARLRTRLLEAQVHSKLIIMSHHARQLGYLADEATIVTSFAPDEVQGVLFGGDIAFLLRDDCITNNVAFPNKFMEYVLSGMDIVSTPYVYDIAHCLTKYDVGVLIANYADEMVDRIVSRAKIRKDFEETLGHRQQIIDDLCFETALRPFVTDMSQRGGQ